VLTAMHSYVLAILGKRRDASVQLAGLSDHLDDPAFVAWKSRALIAAGEKNAAQTLLTRYLRGQQRDPIAWALMLELSAD
jgi:predicted Zn-dependent protease